MKKFINLILFFLLPFFALSQSTNNRVKTKTADISDTLKVKGKSITAISNDATLASNDSNKIATEQAVKQFVLSQIAGIDVSGVACINANTVETITDMQNYNSDGEYLVVNDSVRGGLFKYVLSSTTIDNGITFSATGKGAGYWQRDVSQSKSIKIDWFLSSLDSTTDNSTGIQNAINYIKSQILKVDGSLGNSFGIPTNLPILEFSNGRTYGISSTITPFTGLKIDGNNARIKAISSINAMIEFPQDGSSLGFYTQRLGGICNLMLDGNNLANKGLVTHTNSLWGFNNITSVRVTAKNWPDSTKTLTAASSNGTTYIIVSTTTNINVGDVIRIKNIATGAYRRGAHKILSISGDTLNLATKIIDANQIGDYVDNFANAFQLNSNQNTYTNLVAKKNSIGFYCGQDGNNIGLDDNLYTKILAENNDVGLVCEKLWSSKFDRCTFDFSNYENIIGVNCAGLDFKDVYTEVGTNFLSINAETYPLVSFNGNAIKFDFAFVPTDPAKGWYRPFVIDGGVFDINLVATPASDALENPTHAGDYAVVKMIQSNGAFITSCNLTVYNFDNLGKSDSLLYAIIDSNYIFPIDKATVTGTNRNTGYKKDIGIGWVNNQTETDYTHPVNMSLLADNTSRAPLEFGNYMRLFSGKNVRYPFTINLEGIDKGFLGFTNDSAYDVLMNIPDSATYINYIQFNGTTTPFFRINKSGSWNTKNNMAWDESNIKFGIGTQTPSTALHILRNSTQLNLQYDASDSTLITTTSTGNLNIQPSGAQVNIKGALFPEANNTRDIGSTSFYWANIYGTNFKGNGPAKLLSSGTGQPVQFFGGSTEWARFSATNGNLLIGSTSDAATTDKVQVAGNINLTVPGNKIKIATGANGSIGNGTLSGGTVTINTTAVTASSSIFITPTSNSSLGYLYISAKVAGTSFTVTSTSATDASTFTWVIIN